MSADAPLPRSPAQPEGRCVWCRGDAGTLAELTVHTRDRFAALQEQAFLVHPRHEDDVRAFMHRYRRHGGRFLAGALAFSAVLLIGALVLPFALGGGATLLFVGLLVAAEGALIVWLPFCTPETIRWMGLERAIRLTRFVGAGTALLGAGLAALGRLS